MYLFYDEISGSHNVTEEWIVNSASYLLYSNTGERLAEQHISNNFIWGSPSLIYTLVSDTSNPVTHEDWRTPLESATTEILTKALETMEGNPTDNELHLVTWNGYDYISDSLPEFPQIKVAQQIDKPYSTLYNVAISQGITLNSLKPKDRIEVIMQLYFSSIKKIT